MRERIIKLMEEKGLSQAQFANEIGIQRAAISHIVSGRNNASLDIVIKILKRYPELNSDWLLQGYGNMFGTSELDNLEYPRQTSLFMENDANDSKYDKDFGVKEVEKDMLESENKDIILKKNEYKKVNKIMVFYSDNTYETFVPEINQKMR